MSKKVRINFCNNQNQQQLRPALLSGQELSDHKQLLDAASKKLHIKAKRLFDDGGQEILPDTTSSFVFVDDFRIVASTGHEFVGRVAGQKDKLKKKEDAVVGLSDSSLSELAQPSSSTDSDNKPASAECVVRLIAKESLVEDEAVKQMSTTAQLPRMRLVVGLPDVHPGKGFPIGSASVSEDVFYPHLVGGDIGCGMSLYQTTISTKRLKLDAWTDALHGLEQPWGGDTEQWLKTRGAGPTPHDAHTLGTIGGGNHFAELQHIQDIVDHEAWNALGLDENQLFLLVHSGSRAFGESILREHMDTFGPRGLLVDSEAGAKYMANHDHALLWARANRALIAHRFMSCLTQENIASSCTDEKADPTADGSARMLDVWHNFVTKKHFINPLNDDQSVPSTSSSLNNGVTVGQSLWLHRKGAAPSDQGPVIIPGSRGHFSYLVLPSNDNKDLENAAYSLAHGAGRRWNRGKALQMGKADKMRGDLTTTVLGSKVICENKDLLYEEVPAAYKEIESIIDDLKSFNLVSVIAIFKPIITYKTRVINYGDK